MTISNNPPADQAWGMHIEELFAIVSDSVAGGAVENDEQDAALDALLDDFRKARKGADEARAAEKKPHDDAAKVVQAKFKPLLDRCDMAVTEIKRLLTPYRDAKQKAKDEAARKLREESEAKLKAAQETLRQSDDLETKFAAEAELKQASKLAAVANKIDRAPTGLRTRWEAEVTDYGTLLAHYKKTAPQALKDWLDGEAQRDVSAGARVIPGVIVHERKVAA